jgi:hypothetical protein
MGKEKTKRDNKNSVFTALFSEKEKLLELYNAIENTNYGIETDIRITTLKRALYKGKINDISFVINGKLVVLIEHQSTVNENMPLRMYEYSADVYKKIILRKTLYRRNRITIPKPEFIVLYNGKEKFPDHETYRLSDMFAKQEADGFGRLELEVEVYNINEGRNAEMVKRSEALKGYSFFIYLIREYGKTMNLDAAVEQAIKDCIRQNVLKEFLEENATEVFNMLYGWDDDEALEVAKEEAMEKGLAEGLAKGLAKGRAEGEAKLLALWEKGVPLAEAKRQLGLEK